MLNRFDIAATSAVAGSRGTRRTLGDTAVYERRRRIAAGTVAPRPLALVDLQSTSIDQEPSLRGLVERLASRGGPLLAVCGKPDDAMGEVWSRQLGVWMYLPGVDCQSDIALLCSEARSILEKLRGRAPQLA